MKFDLEKELGLGQPRRGQRSVWLVIILVVCGLNLVLAAVALWRGARQSAPAPPQQTTVVVQQDTQSLELVSARMTALERSLRELRSTVRQSSKNLAAVQAQDEIEERRERVRARQLERQGFDADDIQRAVRAAQVPRSKAADLSSEQQNAFDTLIDSDDSGTAVQQFLLGLNSDAALRAYIQILREKGEQWLDAALALPDDSPDFTIYTDNALYFFDIIAAVSTDSSTLAYVETKRTQIQLATQNRRLSQEHAARTAQTQQEIAELEERLRPKETAAEAQRRLVNERRRRYIKDYPSADAIKPYPTDWDPDPRVREERGIQ
jgi:hypothetical protein